VGETVKAATRSTAREDAASVRASWRAPAGHVTLDIYCLRIAGWSTPFILPHLARGLYVSSGNASASAWSNENVVDSCSRTALLYCGLAWVHAKVQAAVMHVKCRCFLSTVKAYHVSVQENYRCEQRAQYNSNADINLWYPMLHR
jgi:peptidyl-tRNA hydrolase